MHVEPASGDDLPRIQDAYAAARRRQRECGMHVWPEFSDAALLAKVRARQLFLVVDNDVLAGTFAISYQDQAVWGERERGAHVYLHRIARSSSLAVRGLLPCVVAWACAHSRDVQREGIRMDTAADSRRLVAYYEQTGFAVVGRRTLGQDPALPNYYYGAEVVLLEMPCRP